jgi:hypothetical protein
MEKGIFLMSQGAGDLLIISGGVTRVGFPSEAEVGFDFVPNNLRSITIIENKSTSTYENIRFIKPLLPTVESLMVVTSRACIPRARLLVKRLLPEISSVSFVGVRSTAREYMRELIRYHIAVIDPSEKTLIPFLKKCFRKD